MVPVLRKFIVDGGFPLNTPMQCIIIIFKSDTPVRI